MPVPASAGVGEFLAGVKDVPHLGVDATAVQRSFSVLVLQVHVRSSGQEQPVYGSSLWRLANHGNIYRSAFMLKRNNWHTCRPRLYVSIWLGRLTSHNPSGSAWQRCAGAYPRVCSQYAGPICSPAAAGRCRCSRQTLPSVDRYSPPKNNYITQKNMRSFNVVF